MEEVDPFHMAFPNILSALVIPPQTLPLPYCPIQPATQLSLHTILLFSYGGK